MNGSVAPVAGLRSVERQAENPKRRYVRSPAAVDQRTLRLGYRAAEIEGEIRGGLSGKPIGDTNQKQC